MRNFKSGLILAAVFFAFAGTAVNAQNYEYKSGNREFCSNNYYSSDERKGFSEVREFSLPASGKLSVDGGKNGGIAVKGGGSVSLWRERLETRAEVSIEDEEGFPVLVAQGKVNYLAACGDRALMQRIIDQLLSEAGVPTLDLPASVRCRTRGKWRVYFNYGNSVAHIIKAADESHYVLGGAELPAAGVTVALLATGD